jgi:hypothetical protein
MGTTSKAERDKLRRGIFMSTSLEKQDVTFYIGDKQVTISWLRRMCLINFWLAIASLLFSLFSQFSH